MCIHFKQGSDNLRVNHKITILKSLFLIVIITFFYEIYVYNISDAANLASTSAITVTTSQSNSNLIVGGATLSLKATVLPANAANKAVTWSSSNEAVATVSTTGIVTPISEGVALIVVRTVDGGHVDGCLVTVTENDLKEITLTPNIVTLKIKSTYTLKPNANPPDASNKTVIWSSGNENIANVSDAGTVTAIAAGTAGIIGRTVDGNHLIYCLVYVPEEINSITLSSNSLKFNLGDATVALSAKIMPDNISVKGITWTSSNYGIANVDSKGKVTPMSGGTAIITATSTYDKTKKGYM